MILQYVDSFNDSLLFESKKSEEKSKDKNLAIETIKGGLKGAAGTLALVGIPYGLGSAYLERKQKMNEKIHVFDIDSKGIYAKDVYQPRPSRMSAVKSFGKNMLSRGLGLSLALAPVSAAAGAIDAYSKEVRRRMRREKKKRESVLRENPATPNDASNEWKDYVPPSGGQEKGSALHRKTFMDARRKGRSIQNAQRDADSAVNSEHPINSKFQVGGTSA